MVLVRMEIIVVVLPYIIVINRIIAIVLNLEIMENKFGRITEFIESLEKNQLMSQNQQFLLLVGTSGGSGSGGNNCKCDMDNCKCNGDNCNCNNCLWC